VGVAKQYVGRDGTIINALGFWGVLKRGINGTYIKASKKHLPKWLGEFELRWNMRHNQH